MDRQFEFSRIGRIVSDLKKLIAIQKEEITEYVVKNGKDLSDRNSSVENWEKGNTGTVWSELDWHRWFCAVVRIPEPMKGKKVVFEIKTGREGQWDATNPQMLLFVNGKLIQAADVNHREITLCENACAGDEYEIRILAYSGTVPGGFTIHMYLKTVDEKIRKLYYDIFVPLEGAHIIGNTDEDNCRKILSILGMAVDVIDFRAPYSEKFYNSLERAEKILKDGFYTEQNTAAPVVSAVGHTHIDIAWLWTVEQTREKALRSFSTVLALMREYPDYKFMSSQPILYQFVKEQDAEMYEEIKKRIEEGRWEVDGAMWLEADCNLTGGESLVRQILKGHKFFMEEFGTESKCLWLPDVFGYSAALPQILQKSDIPYFMTTKISWNQYNQLPNDMFWWKGLDGTEVFTFMPTACDFDKAAGLNISFSDKKNTTTYTGIINPNMLLGTHKRFQNHELTDNTLMLYGFGDGGGGPTAEMLENAERLKYGLPGFPRLCLEGERDFFDRAYQEVSEKKNMPVWDGELYFECHRGTYTSMAKNKRYNRKSEILYQQLEILSAMASLAGYDYPEKTLEKGWNVILLNQFHDIIPGTCIEAVYKTTDKEYEEILADGKKEVNKIAEVLGKNICAEDVEDVIMVLNTLGYERSDLVVIPEEKQRITGMRSEEGEVLPVQKIKEGIMFFAKKLPPCGYKKFYPVYYKETDESEKKNSVWNRTYENEFYRVIFNEKMQITSLIEKSGRREYIQEGMAGNFLCTYEDRPANWDNWDIDEYYKRKPYEADWVSAPVVVEQGSLETVIEYSMGFGDSTVTQQVCFYRDVPRIDFRTKAQWKTHHVLLRVNFPVDVNAKYAGFEIQFGNVERETTCNQSWDSAKFEVCGHKWADISEHNGGVSLLNDCKYGYGVKNGNLSMTLIKSGTYPNENADIGFHEFTYSVYAHPGRWQEAETVQMAYNLNVPLVVSVQNKKDEKQKLPVAKIPKSLLSSSRKETFLETIKRSEDGKDWIVRMYENCNCHVTASIKTGFPVKKVEECNLLEKKVRDISIEKDEFTVSFKPYEIKTFRFIL